MERGVRGGMREGGKGWYGEGVRGGIERREYTVVTGMERG